MIYTRNCSVLRCFPADHNFFHSGD